MHLANSRKKFILTIIYAKKYNFGCVYFTFEPVYVHTLV
jgi:hypothetical protein